MLITESSYIWKLKTGLGWAHMAFFIFLTDKYLERKPNGPPPFPNSTPHCFSIWYMVHSIEKYTLSSQNLSQKILESRV